MEDRQLTAIDRLLGGIDNALRTINSRPATATRASPAKDLDEATLSEQEKLHAASLMRVNHAGEVAAQGLYHGHAASARSHSMRTQMAEAANEEMDHLAWCEQRLQELDAVPSRLRPIWYGGAFLMGTASGILGDKWSLGFIEETERQVAQHLSDHLQQLPADDQRSRSIVRQMREEEEAHGAKAREAGAATLPATVSFLMRGVANIMKGAAYRF